MTFLRNAGAGAILLLVLAAASGRAAEPCPNAQSPRDVNPKAKPSVYNCTSPTSMIELTGPTTLVYRPRVGGPPQTLHRCGQHYHVSIETPQGCPLDSSRPPDPNWVEIHTVFATTALDPVRDKCDPESLDCCKGPTVLVRGFSATKTRGREDGPIVVPGPAGYRLAEWSGSATGTKAPLECKDPAQWSFVLGCKFRVTEAQLKKQLPGGAQGARPLQTGDNLSKDLTLVTPAKP